MEKKNIRKFDEYFKEIQESSQDNMEKGKLFSDLLEEITDIKEYFILNKRKLDLYNKNISLYKNTSTNNNNQIDDSYLLINLIIDSLEKNVDMIDTITKNVNDYLERGEQFLY